MRFDSVDESVQIRLCRVICIFFMMSVHVNPGLNTPSVISTGALAWIGHVWGDFLGRASVATLSFISGYLLVRTAASSPLARVAARRFQTLIVPMLIWTLIFCLLQLANAAVQHDPTESALLRPGADIVAALTGLTGPTANMSLFFLRDLFVAALIVHLVRPVLAAHPILSLALLGALAVFELTAPVVFRPSILFFVAAGAAWATRAPTLSAGLTPRRASVAVVVLAGALVLLQYVGPLATILHEPIEQLADLVRRGLLVVLSLVASALLTGSAVGALLVPLERRIFETYLMHVPFIGMLWLPWSHLVGGPKDPSYALFFLLAPVAAMVAGVGLGTLCDHLPAPLQKLLRGKATAPPLAAPA